jgi:lysophospholipase L1-like esterase
MAFPRFYNRSEILVFMLTSLTFLFGNSAQAAEKVVVIGDSLSKEYAIEFPALNPGNPSAWGERNWLELLAENRSELVDFGAESLWPDSRLFGHEFNFAFPGSTTSEWVEILTSPLITNPEFLASRLNLNLALTDDADRVVIFLGANDMKNNYGTYAGGADPVEFIDTVVSNLGALVDHVRALNSSVPIVLVNVPDVGATPVVLEDHPDPSQRQRVTDITGEINSRLRQLADSKKNGYADVAQLTTRMLSLDRFVIGGVRFFVSVDNKLLSNDPEYLFSPDGFHVNTSAQLLIANAIVSAFQEAYSQETVVPPFETEELLTILGIVPDLTKDEWSEAYGLGSFTGEDESDGDGATDLMEFALGMDPRVADSENRPQGTWTGNQLELRYRLRVADSNHFIAVPQFSKDLLIWSPVAEDQILVEDGGYRVWVSPTEFPCFLRLKISEL